MWAKLFSRAGSWKTTLAGYALAICGSAGLADEISPFLPEKVRFAMHAFCLLSVVFGLISAKDFNKTNAIIASVQPQTIPVKAPEDGSTIVVKEGTL